ncbi:transient receptor potential cation channel A1 [Leptinotarsa decemlineata]|uniref:transient receptor potential cation channel A1 n=1 Tax=Leptinotarsa decemlineata TaxID=7539 RepID=UPI003D307B64
MMNIVNFFQSILKWKVDADGEDNIPVEPQSTPIITILPPIDIPQIIYKDIDKENDTKVNRNEGERYRQLISRVSVSIQWIKLKVGISSTASLAPDLKRLSNAEKTAEGLCLISQSPFRILRAAENGNLDIFQRLYREDPTRLIIRDGRGRTPAHQAASRNRINILQFILKEGADLNSQDDVGNTPLHTAVEHESLDAVNFLLKAGVRTDILNEKNQAPIHLVTELDRVTVLEVMGRYKEKIDIEQGGEHGRTALHIAAIHDHERCARTLISEFGASPNKPCNNGYYPIHEAAKNASSRTLEVFLQWGESRGCSREEMISFYDSEGNVPLHSAVHGGDIKAVELCIRSGAKISIQQQDLSTAVHLACAQGAIDIVKLMFNIQPEEKVSSLQSCDIQKMTPLHCAAMFDHHEIVEYLIQEGADINAMDKEKRSPLLLAASRGCWRTVHTLIRLGANINLKDVSKRNVLHLIVMNGGRLEEFEAEGQFKEGLMLLLNEKDVNGCSPLHYASREGFIKTLENLIRLGACINLKNNYNETPLHFAARYGRYNTVKQLIDSEKGTFIINESDGGGLTPLHIASQQGHTKVVKLLLDRGALLHRDHNGRTPLHLAAMNGYTQTIELLLSVHSHLLDQTDKDLNTSLHLATTENKSNTIRLLLNLGCKLLYNQMEMSAIDYAIYYKFPEAALAMVTHDNRAQEIMMLKSNKHPCITLALIGAMPEVFEAVQNKCITKAECKKDSKSFYIKYNFTILQGPVSSDQENVTKLAPLPALNAMVTHGRVELLAHPLSQKYLQMKWNSYGKYFHMANVSFYCIFLTFVTSFSSQLMEHQNGNYSINNTSISHEQYVHLSKENILMVEINPVMYMNGLGIITYIGMNVFRELLQLHDQKLIYFTNPMNLLTWLLYMSALTMVLPIFMSTMCDLQFSCASLTIFMSWFNLLLLLQRFDQVGIYVVMFLEILQTLIKVLMVFSILIIAFGLAFYILLSKGEHLSFRTIPMSLIRTFSMMLGEIDFLGTYVRPYYMTNDAEKSFLPFPIPAFLILGLFMVLMPILLMNLLIGLAVGDIESVRRNAQLKRLAMQVELHTELERKLPHCLLEKIHKSELIEYPNSTKSKIGFLDSILKKWFGNPFSGEGLDMSMDSRDDFIPRELNKTKKKLREIFKILDTQQKFLRLIVQKMEIKTEADDVDEGVIFSTRNSVEGSSNK